MEMGDDPSVHLALPGKGPHAAGGRPMPSSAGSLVLTLQLGGAGGEPLTISRPDS